MRKHKYTVELEIPDESDDETKFPDPYEIEKAIHDQLLWGLDGDVFINVEDDN